MKTVLHYSAHTQAFLYGTERYIPTWQPIYIRTKKYRPLPPSGPCTTQPAPPPLPATCTPEEGKGTVPTTHRGVQDGDDFSATNKVWLQQILHRNCQPVASVARNLTRADLALRTKDQ